MTFSIPSALAKNAQQTDPLLLPFLSARRASDDRQALASLDRLIHEYADPIITAAVHRYIPGKATRNGSDMAEVHSQAVYLLLRRLDGKDEKLSCIRDFRAYVKTTAHHVCWRQVSKARVESLVSVVYQDNGDEKLLLDELVPSQTEVEANVIHREQLRCVWKELGLLSQKQRLALLLNLRGPGDGSGFCYLASLVGANQAEQATMLGVPLDELNSLLPLLPLEDSCIGKRLSLTADEAKNARLSARRRLQRRMPAWI